MKHFEEMEIDSFPGNRERIEEIKNLKKEGLLRIIKKKIKIGRSVIRIYRFFIRKDNSSD